MRAEPLLEFPIYFIFYYCIVHISHFYCNTVYCYIVALMCGGYISGGHIFAQNQGVALHRSALVWSNSPVPQFITLEDWTTIQILQPSTADSIYLLHNMKYQNSNSYS